MRTCCDLIEHNNMNGRIKFKERGGDETFQQHPTHKNHGRAGGGGNTQASSPLHMGKT